MTPVVRATGLSRTYPTHPPVEALTAVDLRVEAGERVAVIGASGAGKSTLLNILGVLDEPDGGEYLLLGRDTRGLGARGRDAVRAEHLGFVFQDSHVLGHRTCAQNVAMKLVAAQCPRAARGRLIDEVLERVGLTHRSSAAGRTLSGGEQQRLAIARAVVTRPELLLADEPTGNLDGANAAAVLDLFTEHAARGAAVVVITHDDRLATWADRTLTLVDGRLGPGARS